MFSFSKRVSRRKRNTSDYTLLEDRKMLAAFTGTEEADVVTINITDGQPTSIDINGTLHENPDGTLELDLMDGLDVIHFNGTQEFDIEAGEIPAVTINNNIFIAKGPSIGLTLSTGEGDDIVNVAGEFGGLFLSVETEGGDDQVNLLDTSFYGIILGDGDDKVVGTESIDKVGFTFGGAGHDTFEGWNSFSNFGLNEFKELATGINLSLEFEKYVSSEHGAGSIKAPGDLLVIGETTWLSLTDPDEAPIQLVNFSQFEDQDSETETNRLIHIHETAYPITAKGGYVNIGGDFRAGDTSGIQHSVTLEDTNVLLVTDSASESPHNVIVSQISSDTHAIGGLTDFDAPIIIDNVAHINLASSNTASDFFTIGETASHLILFGNGGDDQFQIGTFGAGLLFANEVVNIVGGDGNDFVTVNDKNDQLQARRFRVDSNWVFTTNNLPDQNFQAISHSGVERLHLIANTFADRFYITPSVETQITITGGKLDLPINELYQLIPLGFGNPNIIDLGNSEFSWYFGETTKFIHLRHHAN